MNTRERLLASVLLIRLEAHDPELARVTRLLLEEADRQERKANAVLAQNERSKRIRQDDLNFSGVGA